jgi:hypothetical protein
LAAAVTRRATTAERQQGGQVERLGQGCQICRIRNYKTFRFGSSLNFWSEQFIQIVGKQTEFSMSQSGNPGVGNRFVMSVWHWLLLLQSLTHVTTRQKYQTYFLCLEKKRQQQWQ